MQIGTFRASHSVMRAVPRVVNGTVLTGMASWRPQQAGMTIEGSAQNFFSRIPIDSELLKGAAAAFVLEMFVDCIGYKGDTPLVATLAHEDRTGSSVH